MKKMFVLNPTLNLLNIKDAIEERLSKMKGILNCLLFANIQDEEQNVIPQTMLYGQWMDF